MQFIDFEVFQYDWLCVIIDSDKKTTTTIINNRKKLKEYYESNKTDIWVGFNIRHYDQYIFKALLLGMNPKSVNDFIIVRGRNGWEFSDEFRKVNIIFYDVMNATDRGLKYFEGSLGNNIKESSIPFNINRELTSDELQETVMYCTHDVEQTMEVFAERIDDFKAHIGLIKMFNLPLSDVSKTKVQLSAKILDAERTSFGDEFNIDIPNTHKIEKYKSVVEWYLNPLNYDYSKSLDIDIAGVPHSFGWGGVHGAIDNYVGEGTFVNMDVASLYPSLMIEYDLISRACNPDKFKDIVATRLKYKAEKNPLQAPLKIVINGTYGASKDKNNPLYDPRQANRVCVYGQLLLLDLIEHLENIGSEIIQSNTDGVLVKIPDDKDVDCFYDRIMKVADEWMKRTRLKLEFDKFHKVFQGDVNNYLLVPFGELVDEKGKPTWKSKGGYVKKVGSLDYDLAIVNEAIQNNLLYDIPVEVTINGCKELKKFQLVKKISSKFRHLRLDKDILNEKCVRVFASKRLSAATLYKDNLEGRSFKVEGTPEHCFIINDDINNMPIPDELDKRWYIKQAHDRIAKFSKEQGVLL